MKKAFVLSALLGLLAGNILAQEPVKKHEVYGGIGLWGTNTIIDAFSDIIVTGLTGGNYSSGNDNYLGEFHLGYKYGLSERAALGLTFAYASNSADARLNGQKTGEFNSNYYTFAAEFDYRYLSRPKLTLYGSVGAGATIYQQKYTPDADDTDTRKSNDTYFNFQLSPIGIKYGERFGIFAEAGFGYKGILSVGLFGRF